MISTLNNLAISIQIFIVLGRASCTYKEVHSSLCLCTEIHHSDGRASKHKRESQNNSPPSENPRKTQTSARVPPMLQTPPCISAPASREWKARLPAKCPGSRDPEHRRTGSRLGMMRHSGHLYALILM